MVYYPQIFSFSGIKICHCYNSLEHFLLHYWHLTSEVVSPLVSLMMKVGGSNLARSVPVTQVRYTVSFGAGKGKVATHDADHNPL